MYSLTYKVTTSTCDSEGKLKLYSALQMMQDCSEMWIDSELEIKDYFLQQNMAQLLATRQVEIIRVPDYKEELTVTTSVYGMKPMFGFRNTFIYDAQGNPCYKTWSMGAFVDKVAGKLKRADDATIQSMKLEPQLEMNYKDRRIILPKTEGEVLEPIKVLRADIDYNKERNKADGYREKAYEGNTKAMNRSTSGRLLPTGRKNLGVCYERGTGVKVNLVNVATFQGYQPAIDYCKEHGYK